MPSAESERLAVLIGRWKTDGWTVAAEGEEAIRVDAHDTYEWLPARSGLLHTVNARMGSERVEGAELIGWDPVLGAFSTLYFGTDGLSRYQARLLECGPDLEWTMASEHDRFLGCFSADRGEIEGFWERLDPDSGDWVRWMDLVLTKLPATAAAAGSAGAAPAR